MSMVLTDLAEFKSKKIFGKTLKYKTVFKQALKLKCAFDQDNSKKREFANFQLGQYQRSQTGLSLLEDMSALEMDVTTL
jgi:hypothetical protein